MFTSLNCDTNEIPLRRRTFKSSLHQCFATVAGVVVGDHNTQNDLVVNDSQKHPQE